MSICRHYIVYIINYNYMYFYRYTLYLHILFLEVCGFFLWRSHILVNISIELPNMITT